MAHDQAHGLRRLFGERPARMVGVLGEEATGLAVELAGAFARMGCRVLLLDRTCGEAARALGLVPRYELRHALCGDRTLPQVALESAAGIVVLPAARALATLDEGPPGEAGRVCAALHRTLGPFDIVLVNGAPLALPDATVLLSLAPTSSAVTLAYTELKRLARQGHECQIVVQHARSEAAALDAFDSVAITAGRFLGMTLSLAGTLPGNARPATARGASPRARAALRIAERLASETLPARRAVNH